MKIRTQSILITFALLCLGLLAARAVSPPPDGGYPGGNTAEGQNALLNGGGTYNTAVGLFALESNVTGDFNTAIGAGTLLAHRGNGENTAVGAGALLSDTGGFRNTASGAFALFSNTEGYFNNAIGDQALFSNTEGSFNTAIGNGALYNNTIGGENTAIENDALSYNTNLLNTGGSDNTAIKVRALYNNTIGSGNTALEAGAGAGIFMANNVICIGTAGADVDNSCYISNISGADATGGDAVFVTGEGKLGTVNTPSSARFKEEIKPINKAREAILALKPVTFRYKKEFDPNGIPQFGLVAEEVEKVNPYLVKRDRDGKLQTVRYDAVSAMLLDEFLKEHRKVQEQEKEIGALKMELKGQRNLIQKVSDRVGMTETAGLLTKNP
jgi:trimeric autotransporter adhesin